MRYVDGFLLPILKRNLKAYRKLAQRAGKIWLEHRERARRSDVRAQAAARLPGAVAEVAGSGSAWGQTNRDAASAHAHRAWNLDVESEPSPLDAQTLEPVVGCGRHD